MKPLASLMTAAAVAAFAGGIALAEGLGGIAPPAPPAPPPPPEQPAPPAPAGLVTSVNLQSIKAVFDGAGVPATLEKTSDGFSFIAATLAGNFVATAPIDCENADPNGKCGAVAILSGTWPTKLTPAQANAFAQDFHLSQPLLVGQNEPMLRYIYVLNDGVGPAYLENTLVIFAHEMQAYGEFIGKNKQGPGSAFSTEGTVSEKAGKFGSSVDFGKIIGAPAKGGKLTP